MQLNRKRGDASCQKGQRRQGGRSEQGIAHISNEPVRFYVNRYHYVHITMIYYTVET